MSSKQVSRRHALKMILGAMGGIGAAAFLPSGWLKPVVRSGVLPVHAMASRASSRTQVFSYTGAEQTFIVPGGVTHITVDAWGASGGGGNDTSSNLLYGDYGLGAYIQGAVLMVTPGETLNVYVGRSGHLHGIGYATTGGFNGGGDSGDASSAGGGGGASDVRQGGSGLAKRVLVAGGGGGGGWIDTGGVRAGKGGDSGLNGAAGGNGGGAGGQGATQSAGGAGGSPDGGNGALWTGGLGGSHGGGGGGGLYGGGGGGGDGGGGGGSSLVPAGASLSLKSSPDNFSVYDGQVIITW